MKPFRFTLEALGTLRRRQEQKSMEQYSQCLKTRNEAAEALKAAESDLSLHCEQRRRQLRAGCTAEEASQAHAYHLSLAKRQEECVLALETAERRVSAALQNLSLARQRREIVDKCFDKQRYAHQKEQARNEQKFMDDLAARRRNSVLAWRAVETSL